MYDRVNSAIGSTRVIDNSDIILRVICTPLLLPEPTVVCNLFFRGL